MAGDKYKCHLESPDKPIPPSHQARQSGSKSRGRDSQQRALVCRVGAEVTGDEMSTA